MIKRRTGEVIVTNEKQGQLLKKLYGTADGRRLLKFLSYIAPINDLEIPPTSLLREFLGGSSFKY